MYTDTHCHVLSMEYDDILPIINNLKQNNIKRIIVNGYDYKSNLEVLDLIERYENVYGALGVHPNNLFDGIKSSLELIEKNINHPKIVAIGEIGLDYHYENNRAEQIKNLSEFLNLAKKYHKPVIIHNRDSIADLLSILKKYQLKGIIHCFSGSYEVAQELIKLGYSLGINGIVTFKNSNLPSTLHKIPIEKIFIETDCPYIAPEPFRKVKNEPKYLNVIAKKVAAIYNISPEKLAEILEQNYLDFFDIRQG